MRTWSAPEPPSLPGSPPPVRLYDSASGTVREVGTLPVAATMYVCGITPYDATHLGHAATYVAFDLLSRLWRDAGREVNYVQNVTDVDDPLLERAAETGQAWDALAAQETELFRDDMAWLNVLPPQHFVGAVEAIPLIIDLIEQLKAAGAVYDVDGDLYFSVRTDPHFGGVAGLDDSVMRTLSAERGGDPDRAGKDDPLDCLLWQQQRPGEPGWDSPFGRGRPGWHVECAAIALSRLGAGFDVQGGGNDLVFPHHEMCASEAQVATGEYPFAQSYVHAGMLGLDGEKMSKSLGNLVFASVLRENGENPAAVRLALLASHYRADREWTPGTLAAGIERLELWRAGVEASSGPGAESVVSSVRTRLADDLDTPGALASIDEWATAAKRGEGADPAAPALIRTLADSLLGIKL